MVDNSLYPKPSSDFQESILDNEMILYSATNERAMYLNESSQLIWRLCDGQSTVFEIVETLTGVFPEANNMIENQVHETLQEMAKVGVIVFAKNP